MPTVNLALHKDLILKTPKCANRITALYEAGLRIVAVSRVCHSVAIARASLETESTKIVATLMILKWLLVFMKKKNEKLEIRWLK